MRLLKKHIQETVHSIHQPITFERTAARGIVIHGNEILLIYTKRYNDYSIPGGGVDPHENIKEGLVRELKEETGAKNVAILDAFGVYEEFRPTHYEDYDIMHMNSYFYTCSADYILGEAKPEEYEIRNGSVAKWVSIEDAIAHNKKVMADKEDSMGLSIERETFVLELIQKELFA